MRQAPLIVAKKLIWRTVVENGQFGHLFLDLANYFVELGVTLTERLTFAECVQDRVLDAFAGVGRKFLGQTNGFLVFDGQCHNSILMLQKRPVRVADDCIFGDQRRFLARKICKSLFRLGRGINLAPRFTY
jgi:hypothetical protein